MSHILAVAKASFAASMMKPDPFSLNRQEITSFHDTLDALLQLGSPVNIQRCRDWLVKNVVDSSDRIVSLGKFIIALSQSFEKTTEERHGTNITRGPPVQRKRLNVLYLLHDTLHQSKFHHKAHHEQRTLSSDLHICLKSLVRALTNASDNEGHVSRVHELLDLWASENYLEEGYVQELRDIAEGKLAASDAVEGVTRPDESGDKKGAPCIMPASHGDASTPFYDLPASNMIPHIIPNSTRAINPQLMKPLQFAPGPIDRDLASALKSFLEEIDSVDQSGFEERDPYLTDLDALGQYIMYDGTKKYDVHANGYYGWSRQFCQRMKNSDSVEDMTTGDFTDEQRPKDVRPERRQSSGLSPSDRERVERSRSSSPWNSYSSDHNRSPTRSYSPPSPSLYRDTESAAASRYIEEFKSRSPSIDPRRPPPLRLPGPPPPPASHATPKLYSQVSQYNQRPLVVPPRPTNYHGPWPPPPPPTTQYSTRAQAMAPQPTLFPPTYRR